MDLKTQMKSYTHNKKRSASNPCTECFYGAGATDCSGWKCPWADRLEPVPGWIAYAREYWTHNGSKYSSLSVTFEIEDCPHFAEG